MADRGRRDGLIREYVPDDRPRAPRRAIPRAFHVPGYAVSLTLRAARAPDPCLFPPFEAALARRRHWARLRAALGWSVPPVRTGRVRPIGGA